jgi:hypothetical protein
MDRVNWLDQDDGSRAQFAESAKLPFLKSHLRVAHRKFWNYRKRFAAINTEKAEIGV